MIKKKITLMAFAALTWAFLQGCSSEESITSGDFDDEMGDVVVGITDAPGDFVNYEVSVQSLKLTHQNGAEVETLPRETNIDFAQYVELTEFLTIATVPRGQYVKGSMILDYTDASIYVENEAGETVKVDSIVDENGDAVTTIEMDVNFENANRVLIAPGVPAHLTVDFDLQASNTVDLTAEEGVQVTVEPVLLGELAREGAKAHRARGALRAVDVDRSAFSLFIRPGRNPIDQTFGDNHLVVLTDDSTHFEIDGAVYEGGSGLLELNNQQSLSAVVATGNYRFNPIRFVANAVYAGTSVPGGDQDLVQGAVISRSGDQITLKGASLVRSDGVAQFNEEVVMNLADVSVFTMQASSSTVTSSDISVGQRISATGSLSRNAEGEWMLDASEGSVRLLLTYLSGAVVGEPDYLVVDLSSIGGRSPSVFDFSGTGVSAEFDADPNAYEIDKNGLQSESLDVASTLKVAGHVQSFGMAPADFTAQTIVDVSALPATLRVNWTDPTESSVMTNGFDELTLDLSGTGRFHHISQAGSKLDLTIQSEPTSIKFSQAGTAYFVLIENGTRVLHTDVSTFIADLDTRLAQGAVPAGLHAVGDYENANNSLTARRLDIRIQGRTSATN